MADLVGFLWTLLEAIIAGAIAAGIGYYKKTPKQQFDPEKAFITVMWAMVLAIIGVFLGFPSVTPTEMIDASIAGTAYYTVLVYGTQAIAQLLWRKILLPLWEKINGVFQKKTPVA